MHPSRAPDLLERGRELFNAGRYFEAHEVWEDAWLAEKGETRRFLQGLIQITAGFHKGLRQGQPGGCVRLLEAGLSKIAAPAPAAFEIEGFTRSVTASLEAAKRWERGELQGLVTTLLPRLELKKERKIKL